MLLWVHQSMNSPNPDSSFGSVKWLGMGPAGNKPHQQRDGFLPSECCKVAESRAREGARVRGVESFAAVQKDVMVWHLCCCGKWVMWVRWISCVGPWRYLMRSETVEEMGRCDVCLTLGLEGRSRLRREGEQRNKSLHLASCCYGLKELYLRAFTRPEVHGMVCHIHLFESGHWTWWPAWCHVLSCQLFQKSLLHPKGQEGKKDAMWGLSISSCQQERISRLKTGRGK